MVAWERVDRETLVDTPFLKVYSDKVRLPNGSLIDYTVVKKRDIAMIVATDTEGRVLTQQEYRYAVNETLKSLPGGQIDKNESPEEAAARELLEETGYGGGEFELVDVLYEYPTKDAHTITVVRAKNVSWQKDVVHEETENISQPQWVTIAELKRQIQAGEWKTTSAIAGLTRALPELFDAK
jgi:8-oxo-dGTP pyrophosphatase MutT (NUDIX family)